MMEEIKNYGFTEPSVEELEKSQEKGYVLGARGGVQGKVIKPDGDWRGWLSKFKPQRRKIETSSCTEFGNINADESLELYIYGITRNYSERALSIEAGNSINGNSPHKTAETWRKMGLAPDRFLPFTDEIGSWEEYMSGMNDEVRKAMKAFLKEYSPKHEWVFNRKDSPKEKRRKILEALTKGTVCVSVVAWRERNGLYVKEQGEPDGHWAQLSFTRANDPYYINDSYLDDGKPEKLLDPFYDFNYAKVYYLPRCQPNWWKQLMQFLRN